MDENERAKQLVEQVGRIMEDLRRAAPEVGACEAGEVMAAIIAFGVMWTNFARAIEATQGRAKLMEVANVVSIFSQRIMGTPDDMRAGMDRIRAEQAAKKAEGPEDGPVPNMPKAKA